MNINVIDAKLDGLDLETGDEIGVFDGDLCVGYGKVTQTINQQNSLLLAVSQNDGSENGYTVGHEVWYVLWDCSLAKEYPVQNVQCFDFQINPIVCSPFTSDATTFVSLEAFAKENQQITLEAGWNIMSLMVMPEDVNLKDVLQSLIDEGTLKKVMDESGNLLEDWGLTNGGWKNTIGDMQNTEGYKINVTSSVLFELTGIPVHFPFDIPLKEGWNIISWPSPMEQNGMDVFQDLINEGKLEKVMDESGFIIEDWGALNGGWRNFIGTLKPGEGYKVNVSGECILTIYEMGPKSEGIIPELVPSAHFIPAFTGNGTDHMNINLVNLAESGIADGDEIGVFDGEICVGSAQIINNNLSIINNQFSVSIPVSATDGIGSKNGYSDGNPITLKLFRNGKEYPVTIEPLNNSQPVFEKGSSLFAQLALPTGLEGITNRGFADVKVYPNPFTDEVNVEINLASDAQVQVEVLNQLGQRVKMITTKQLLPGGLHKLTWDGRNTSNREVAPGFYHIRIGIDDSIVHRKIVLSK
jgi:hypothetical protein